MAMNKRPEGTDKSGEGLVEIGRTDRDHAVYREPIPEFPGLFRYWSDYVGGGVVVLDEALFDLGSLKIALADMAKRQKSNEH